MIERKFHHAITGRTFTFYDIVMETEEYICGFVRESETGVTVLKDYWKEVQ